MAGAAAISVGGAILGGVIQGNAAQNAASTEASAANNASAVQQQEFAQQQKNEQPYMDSGKAALGQLNAQLPSLEQNFTPGDLQNTPGYQFQLQQGNNAIQASAAARGLLNSTGTMKSIDNYSQGLAQTDYNNAFSQYNSNRQMNYNMLANSAGIGQTAVAGANAAGQNAANNISANTIGAGNAAAAGQVGTANAFGGALSSIGGTAGQYGMMNYLQGMQPSGAVPYSAPSMGSTITSGGDSLGSYASLS